MVSPGAFYIQWATEDPPGAYPPLLLLMQGAALPEVLCVSQKATADCYGKNRYLMGAGRSIIKHHLHMEFLTQGTSPVRNEVPLVSGRHYSGVTRGQVRYCLDFSKCESQDLQGFYKPECFLSGTCGGIKCS